MESKNILNVHIDMQRGEYILSRNNGQEIVIKPITKKYFDKSAKDAKIQEIKKIHKYTYVPTEKEEQIDPELYDALEEFDKLYGTNYRKDYLRITIEQITFAGISEKRKDWIKRTINTKREEFKEAGLNICYDLNIFKVAKNLSIPDRIKMFRIALSQRINGIQAGINRNKVIESQLLAGQIPEEIVPEENIVEDNSKSEEPAVEAPKIEEENLEQQPSEQIIAAKIQEEPKAEKRPTYEPKAKKAMSRSKTIQASKRAAREAGKMKNIYQTKVKDKTKPVKTQQQIQEEARARKQAKAQKAAEAARMAKEQAAEEKRLKEEQEQERLAKEEQARQDAKLSSRVKRIILGKKASENQEEHVVRRFTRKLKDQKDSIRNKIHIPKPTKRTIAGAVGTVCVVVAIGLGINALANNRNITVENTSRPTIETTYESKTELESSNPVQSKPEEKDYTEAINQAIRFEQEEQTPTVTAPNIKTEETTPSTEKNTGKENEESTITDSSTEYLSSVKVGATMNIESGKYFECPDGTGNYGYFENQTGAKEISMIGVSTNKGYFAIKDPSISLYDLKQQYPDAKFSYHFICRYEDGSTKILGWLTENSMEQNLDNTRQLSVDEGR